MSYVTVTFQDFSAPIEQQAKALKSVPQNILGAAALGCIGLACMWTLFSNVAGPEVERLAVREAAIAPQQQVSTPKSARAPLAEPRVAMLDPQFSLGYQPKPFALRQIAKAEPLPAPGVQETTADSIAKDVLTGSKPTVQQLVQAIPLPTPRPTIVRAPQPKQDIALGKIDGVELPVPPKKLSIFEKLFGKQQSTGPVLAFAGPDGGVTSDGSDSTPRYDRTTAVYDISAHTVYLPDGTKLEAHSGLGSRLDDPRYVHEKMHGATPPYVYDLTLRESLFHGVQALRLNPVNNGSVFGRTGLLAHTYMLGPNGDSNGCVSFRNYEAFLRAFRNGDIKRLAVVSSL